MLPLPAQNHKNVFIFVEIRNPLIAINTEGHTYVTLSQKELKKCVTIGTEYLYTKFSGTPHKYRESICEIEIYLDDLFYIKQSYKSCNIIR